MPEVNRRWVYPTVTASENKGIERTALSGEGKAHEVVGVDGSRRFGCRPSSGFRLAHTFDIYKDFSGSAARPFSATAPPTFTKASKVTDCFPVSFQIREGEFGHGFVYRVSNLANDNAAIFMDYVPTSATVDYTGVSGATGWRTVLISDHETSHPSKTAKMDVVSMGKYVITLVKGRPSRIFYIDWNKNTGSPVYTSKVVDGGAGLRPLVRDSGASNPGYRESTDGGGSGPYIGRQVSYTTGGTNPLQGKLIDVAHDAAPSVPADTDFHKFRTGNYSFAYYLHDSHTGRRTPISTICSRDENSAIDANGKYIGFILDIDVTLYDEVYMFRSVKQQDVGGTYTSAILHLDTIYDINDAAVDTEAKVDTSANSNYTIGGSTDILKAYKFYYQLDDIALAMQDIYLDKTEYETDIPHAGSGVSFDGTLVVSDPQGETTLVSNLESRSRNIGEIRWSSLTERSPELFPINNKYTPDLFQNRVESLAKAGEFVVGFSADRIYHIRRNGIYFKIEDMHAGFGLASQNGFASAGPLCYFVTSKGLKAVANNGQLDDVQALDNLLMEDWKNNLSELRLSYDPYASCLFVHNPFLEQTVCMWFNTGRITELHDTDFDDVRSGMWPQTYTRNAFDDTSPTPTTSTTMVERSFFFQNHPQANFTSSVSGPSSTNVPDGWKPRVYILDIDRDKKQVNSTDIATSFPIVRTLDCGGDSIFTIATIVDQSNSKKLTLKSGTSGTKKLGGGGSGIKDLIGAYAYVLSASDSTIVGESFQIYSGVTGNVTADGIGGGNGNIVVSEDKPNGVPDGLAVGDVIAISPMKVRYVGGSLPMIRTEDKKVITTFDMFQNKQISSLGCHFTDVTGGVTGYKFFRGLVYNTESDSPAVNAFPLDFSGTIIGESIKNGESDDYAAFTTTGLTTTGKHGIQDSALNPGFETFCPDLDFKLMALICRGRTTGTDTGERNSS